MNIEEDILTFATNPMDDDYLGIPIEPLTAFWDDFESADIDSFLQKFEDTEKLTDTLFSDLSPLLGDTKTTNAFDVDTNSRKRLEKEKRIEWSRSEVKIVRKKKVKGISLLAKPPKKKSNGSKMCPSRFAAYFYQHHDYCYPASNPIRSCDKSYDTKDTGEESHIHLDSLLNNPSLNRSEPTEVDYNVDNIINLDEFNYNEIDISCDLYDVDDDLKGINETRSNGRNMMNLIKRQ